MSNPSRLTIATRAIASTAFVALLVAGCVTGQVQSPPTPPEIPSVSVGPAVAVSALPASTAAPTITMAPTDVTPGDATSRPGSSDAIEISETSNGLSFTLSVGATLRLVLHNTYWTIGGSSVPSVLALTAPPVYSAAGLIACIPGTGCGTVTASFRALAPGKAVITAARTSCGEALRCVGGDGAFEATVIVGP
jgi:hypothetical protein